MHDKDKLALATQFTVGDHHGPHRPVMVELTDDGHGPHTGDGIKRWAVRSSGGACLEVGTRDTFVYEPMPSNREDDWLARHRFTDLDDALAAARAAHGWERRRQAERAADAPTHNP